MSDNRFNIPYNQGLSALEEVLSCVSRPGDYFVAGALETPMPRMEVEGVGRLSFPLPDVQIQGLIGQATRAPYGRGTETLVDESVRRVWQVTADRVRLEGKAWDGIFPRLLAAVHDGLGCEGGEVKAELYKLLVYETGGFFKSHRDTEKVEGMFGTMVVVLPSSHRGGELVVRHESREAVVAAGDDEACTLPYTAFYADCEHEVLPVTQGTRVCLVYNLIQVRQEGDPARISVPGCMQEAGAAAGILRETFDSAKPPVKLVWLLSHQYSPAGLRFSALKGVDASVVRTLREAAKQAACAVHLGIVHIEERGPAESRQWDRHAGRSRRMGYGRSPEREVDSPAYEVMWVDHRELYIDPWMGPDDRPVAFGKLSIGTDELLPDGALDGEKPDEDRLAEATGNEGASFERAYHRAALVLWPQDRQVQVLLQAGVVAVLPHLGKRLDDGDPSAREVARLMVDQWPQTIQYDPWERPEQDPVAVMLGHLVRLGDRPLLMDFLKQGAAGDFNARNTDAFAQAIHCLGPDDAEELLLALVNDRFDGLPGECVTLLGRVLDAVGNEVSPGWRKALGTSAAILVRRLPTLASNASTPLWTRCEPKSQPKGIQPVWLEALLHVLSRLGLWQVRLEAAGLLLEKPDVFVPVTVLLPALEALLQRGTGTVGSDKAAVRLWTGIARFLLSRSAHPPRLPGDWRQDVRIACPCGECRELETFARDSRQRIARFQVRLERRHHIQSAIFDGHLDMTCTTDASGSPHTLVCTKNREGYKRECLRHAEDSMAMTRLLRMLPKVPAELAPWVEKLTAATMRKSQPLPE